jgi:hypothetical protein
MGEWFRSVLKYIGKQRRVLLLLDNFSAHLCALEDAPPPSNIKGLFIPPNTTSIYQPLDEGIIQNLNTITGGNGCVGWLIYLIGTWILERK